MVDDIAAPTSAWLLGGAIESMREAMMITDADLEPPGPRILFVNRAFCEMTGHRAQDVIGQSPRLLQGPATDRETLQRLSHRLEQGQTFEGRAINYRKTGEPYVLEWYIEPIRDEEGVVTHYVAIQRDVTDEEARDASLKYLSAAFEHAEEAILVLSGSGVVNYDNHVARQFFGGQVVLSSEAWAQLRDHGSWHGKLETTVGNESRRLATKVREVAGVYPGERNYVLTASDVTEVERLESIATSVNLSDNIGHFLSGIRHELGNPTNSIKTALTVLRSNLGVFSPDKVDDYLGQVLDEVSRIEHLLRSLRSYTAHESMQLGLVEIGEVFAKITALISVSVERAGVALHIETPPPGTIFVDERALYQVFINLVSNALEAIDDIANAQIRIEFAVVSGAVEISVVDNGPGMSDSQIRMIARPFYTTKRTGTGLGLTIVARLLKAVDGSLRLTSESGCGTRAIVRLPLSTRPRHW